MHTLAEAFGAAAPRYLRVSTPWRLRRVALFAPPSCPVEFAMSTRVSFSRGQFFGHLGQYSPLAWRCARQENGFRSRMPLGLLNRRRHQLHSTSPVHTEGRLFGRP